MSKIAENSPLNVLYVEKHYTDLPPEHKWLAKFYWCCADPAIVNLAHDLRVKWISSSAAAIIPRDIGSANTAGLT